MSLFPTETMSQLAQQASHGAYDTYVPLYRKYRPQSLGELVGQETIVQTLTHAIELHKIVNAYLFCGPRGTGKTSSARIFAKSLNCEQGPTVTPCQTCASCVSITTGNALDVTEIDAASNNGVDDIRELTERVQFAPIQGKFRIYIIDEVHMLSTAAFNALLKTLEEPPPSVIFIFATTEAHKVLPTIISRCQRYDFSRITRQQIEARLRWVAEQESIQIQDEALTAIARNARGGMRDALSLLDQVSVIGKAESTSIDAELIRTMIGALTEDKIMALTSAITTQDPVTLVALLQELVEIGIDIPQIVRGCVQHYRHMMLIQAVRDANNSQLIDVLDISDAYFEALKTQAKQYQPEEPPQILARLSQLENMIKHSASPLLWLEVLLLEICYRDRIHQLADLEARIQALETNTVSVRPASKQVMAKPPVATSAPAVMSPETVVSPPIPVQPPTHLPTETVAVITEPPAVQAIVETPASVSVQRQAQPEAHPANNSLGDNSLLGLGQKIFEAVASHSVQSLLFDHCQLIEHSESNLTFAFKTQPVFSVFNRPEKVKLLEQAVEQIIGQPCRLNFTVKAFTTSAPKAALPQATTQFDAKPTVVASPAPQAVTSVQPQPTAYTSPVAAPATVLESPVSQPAAPTQGTDYDLMESKRFAQELLQGKIIER